MVTKRYKSTQLTRCLQYKNSPRLRRWLLWMLLNFAKKNFISPFSKNLIMFEKKRKGLAVLSKFKIWFYTVQSLSMQNAKIINKDQKVEKMHLNYPLNKNQQCLSKETIKQYKFNWFLMKIRKKHFSLKLKGSKKELLLRS